MSFRFVTCVVFVSLFACSGGSEFSSRDVGVHAAGTAGTAGDGAGASSGSSGGGSSGSDPTGGAAGVVKPGTGGAAGAGPGGEGGVVVGGAGGVAQGGSGNAGSGGSAGTLTCEEITSSLAGEIHAITECSTDAECGQVISGSSCGCTRDLVARLDASLDGYASWTDMSVRMGCDGLVSTCDCPEADGFACVDGHCTWNYVQPAPTCIETAPAMICVRGTQGTSGETLAAGEPLQIQVTPTGCWSSSCTAAVEASCSISGTSPFEATASFCLASNADPSVGCTADCGGGGFANCEGSALTEGEHTITMGNLSLTFSVPSTIDFGGLCAGSPF